jgi:hypothetical protein
MNTPKSFLEWMSKEEFQFKGGPPFRIDLRDGLSATELLDFEASLPGPLPEDIRELLCYAKGFSFDFLGDVSFVDTHSFYLEGVFNFPIALCQDTHRNFWLLEVGSQGEWGPVFFFSYSPPALVKEAENLTQYLKQLWEYGTDYKNNLEGRMQQVYGEKYRQEHTEFMIPQALGEIDDEQIRSLHNLFNLIPSFMTCGVLPLEKALIGQNME